MMQRTVPHWENTRAFRDYDAWKTSAPEPQGVCPVCDADFWPDGDGGCAECAERQAEALKFVEAIALDEDQIAENTGNEFLSDLALHNAVECECELEDIAELVGYDPDEIAERSKLIGAFLDSLPPERARRFWQRMFGAAREEIAAQKQRRAMREEGA